MNNRNFIGRGWQFPPTFSPQTGQVLMSEDEYDWDSIDEVPIFNPNNVRHNDFVIVITLDSTLGYSRKEYKVENPSNRGSDYGPIFGDLTLDDSNSVTFYDDDGNATGGYVRITAGGCGDGYDSITIPTSERCCYKTKTEMNGGDITITAGEAFGSGEAGTVRITGSAIYLDAPQVIVGPQEEEWQTLSTSKND